MRRVAAAYGNDAVAAGIREAKLRGDRKVPVAIFHKAHLELEMGGCKIVDNLLYVRDRLWVPQDKGDSLRTYVIQGFYDTPVGGHAGRATTYHRVSTHYY